MQRQTGENDDEQEKWESRDDVSDADDINWRDRNNLIGGP